MKHGKIDSIFDFTDKGFREVEAGLEPWFLALVKTGLDPLSIRYNTRPQNGPAPSSWIDITTTGVNPDTDTSFNFDTSSGVAQWQIAGFQMFSILDGSILFDNSQVVGNMAFNTAGTMQQSGVDWEVTVGIGGHYEMRLNVGGGDDISYSIRNYATDKIFEVVGSNLFTDVKIAFFNATPAEKQTGVAVSAAGIHAALVSYGLISA